MRCLMMVLVLACSLSLPCGASARDNAGAASVQAAVQDAVQDAAHVGAQVGAQVAEADWPGTITLNVDASDVSRRIQRVRERIPVQQPGPLTLWYPRWIPGHHAPTGPINQLAGLTITGNGARIAWRRDAVDMYAFHVDVPAGVDALDIEFQYLSPTASDQGRVAMTPAMLAVQWHRVLLYPAGFDARRIRFAPSLTVPAGWQSGSALDVASRDVDTLHFKPLALVDLVDSPLYAGRWFKRFDLDPGAEQPVHLDVMADAPELLDATPAMLDAHRGLVRQSDRVFGARPFAHYDFLLALSDQFSGIGLEHHQSSENGTYPGYLRGDAPFTGNDLLPHEYSHAWNGKYRRPAPSWTPHFNTPMRGDLLWLYEGQTNYWAMVLAARAGLWNNEQAHAVLAELLATQTLRRGRDWRNLQDTVSQGIIEFNDAPQAWESWQRAYDFYGGGALLWLDVDGKLRELSKEKRSLDDFAHAFFGGSQGRAQVSTYTFDDVIAALDAVQPFDWAAFLRERLDATAAPLDGFARSGWRLAWNDAPNAAIAAAEDADGNDDFRFSLGLKIARDGGKIEDVMWDGPAFKAGLARDMQVIAVAGTAYTAARLQQALIAAKDTKQPIELLLRQGDSFSTHRIDYHGGVRSPRLERIPGTPDRLSQMLQPR
ncbi:MAG: M61 family metallopeptidase [Luteimonas sp.]